MKISSLGSFDKRYLKKAQSLHKWKHFPTISSFQFSATGHLCDMAALIMDTLNENYAFKTADTCFVFSANVLLLYISFNGDYRIFSLN